MTRIGINFSYKLIANRGIARFIENIIINLPQTQEYELFFFFPNSSYFDNKDELLSKSKKNIVTKIKNFFIFEHIWIPFILKKTNCDVLINPANTVPLFKVTKKWITIIHDIIPFKLKPKLLSKKWFANFYIRRITEIAILKSDRILTVSNYSRMDILKTFKTTVPISIIFNGFDHKIFNNISTYDSLPLQQPYVFWLGGDGYNKNLPIILEVLKKKPKEINIVCLGIKKKQNKKLLEKFGAKVLTSINDSTLADIYRNAKVFIFPSLYEGFGIPILEAMHYKVPYIIASNTTSIPEVCGNCCYLFDPYKIDDFIDLIESSLSNKLKTKVELYQKQILKFSWINESHKLHSFLTEIN